MVTYCIGSARRKREYFKAMGGVVLLDNVEVLFCASEDGYNYFAYGDAPFSAFTVREYLEYRRALCKEKADLSMLAEFRLSPNTRMSKLSPVAMRCVQFLEKTAGNPAQSTLIVNLDGAKYTRRDNARLKRLLALAGNAYVCVSDNRFLKRAGAGAGTLAFGKATASPRPAFYSARVLAKRIGAKRISVM